MKWKFAEEKERPVESSRKFKFSDFDKNEKQKEKRGKGQKEDKVAKETADQEKIRLERKMVDKKEQAKGEDKKASAATIKEMVEERYVTRCGVA